MTEGFKDAAPVIDCFFVLFGEIAPALCAHWARSEYLTGGHKVESNEITNHVVVVAHSNLIMKCLVWMNIESPSR